MGPARGGGDACSQRIRLGLARRTAAVSAAGRDNNAAIASLILGITSIVLPLIGLLAAPFAIIFGIIGRRRAHAGASRGGMATAGLTLGAIALALWGALLAGGAVAVMGTSGGTEERVPVEPAGEPPH